MTSCPTFAGLMPSYVIADMLGIPHEDGVALYELTEASHAAPESQAAGAAMHAVINMFNYNANGVWQARRAEPTDDLANIIAHATVDGDELDVIDFNLFFLLLIDAGGDTDAQPGGRRHGPLFAHPEQMEWLTADLDTRLAPAVEELLRWISPVVYMRRTAQRDTSCAACRSPRARRSSCTTAPANRDRRRSARPPASSTSSEPPTTTSRSVAADAISSRPAIARQEIRALLRGCSPAAPTSVRPARPSGSRRRSSPGRSTCRSTYRAG